jgi:hypothetical protein
MSLSKNNSFTSKIHQKSSFINIINPSSILGLLGDIIGVETLNTNQPTNPSKRGLTVETIEDNYSPT